MNWNIKSRQIAPESVEELVTRILEARGLATDEQSVSEFIKPVEISLDYLIKSTDIPVSNINKAVKLVEDSIKKERPIIVYGDYDVDGVCATAIIWQTLHSLKANALPFIPLRLEHGYGLSDKGLKAALELFENKSPLIITVDNGITGAALIDKYQSLGVDFLITDHHLIPSFAPKPQVLVHSTAVCGTTLAFILSFALLGERPPLDLVALATVCDQLPLVGINRQIVRQGLSEIRKPTRLGLKILITEAGIANPSEIDTYHLGFVIGPRINAAGRLGHALDALRLLCTGNEKQATDLAGELKKLNEDRQGLTQSGIDQALIVMATKTDLPKIILVASPDYHEGIIGLIAAKLSDRFHRPAIAIATGEETSKASARSVPGIDIVALLRQVDHLFLEIGGHEGAAGFTLKTSQISKLEAALVTLENSISDLDLTNPTNIDLLLHPDQDLSFVNLAIKQLSPYGSGFQTPTLALDSLTLHSQKIVGALGVHLQLQMKNENGGILKCICFNKAKEYIFKTGDNLSAAFLLQENTFMGNTSLQLNIQKLEIAP